MAIRHAEIKFTKVWKFKGKIYYVQEFFILLDEIFLKIRYLLVECMLIPFDYFEGSG